MELKLYLAMARRWAWLLVLGLVLGATGGAVYSSYQTPIFQASTRILVMRAPQEKSSDYTYLTDQQLVQNYIQILTTSSVMKSVSDKLGSSVSATQIRAQQLNNTQAIQLIVEDKDPQRATDIANLLVEVLIEQNEVMLAGRYTLSEASIQAQITQIEDQISQLETDIDNISSETVQQQITQVEAQIASMQLEVTQLKNDIEFLSPARNTSQQLELTEKEARLSQLEPVLTLYQQIYSDLIVLGKPVSSGDGASRLTQLQSTLQLYQQIYINLLNNMEAIRLARLQNTPNLIQIEPAAKPGKPVRPQPIKTTGLSAVVGLMLAGGIAFLIEYIDDTIRTPEDVEQVLGLPVIGYIGTINPIQNENVEVHVLKHPRSPVSEAFRSLRTNLDFMNVDRTVRKILISSPGPGEGKTTVAANLAMMMAQGGKRVLLVDADMRRPRIHIIFDVPNRVGLSTLFRGKMPLKSVVRQVNDLENLFVIASGSQPPNPNELLGSGRMDSILQEACDEFDIVILDSPPAVVADHLVLATKMDGVIMVLQPGHTRVGTASAMLEQLMRINSRVLGIIMNKIPNNSYYYGAYYHYDRDKRSGYYEQEKETARSVPPKDVKLSATYPNVNTPQKIYKSDSAPLAFVYEKQDLHLGEIIRSASEKPGEKSPGDTAITWLINEQASINPLPKETIQKPKIVSVPDTLPIPNTIHDAPEPEYVLANYNLEYWIETHPDTQGKDSGAAKDGLR